MTPVIRQASSTDLDLILAFDARRDYVRQALNAGTCHVALLENRAAGYGVLDYHFYDNGFIEMIFVDLGHRRHRVGDALVAHLESICRTEKLFTSTNLSNLPMQSLLARRGYALSGVIHNLDEGDPEIVYVKFLAQPNQHSAGE